MIFLVDCAYRGVCESATISQRSINDDDSENDKCARSLLSGVDIVRTGVSLHVR